jgi:hypothetical protein
MHLLMQSQMNNELQDCRVEKHTYGEGHVSWTNTGGTCYLHTMDREWHARRVQECLQRFNNGIIRRTMPK